MRFPSYESYDLSAQQPLDGYLAYVGSRNSREPYTTYQSQTKQHAAALLAQGCTQLTVEGNQRQAKRTFLEAQRVLVATEGVEGADNEPTLGLSALIHAVAFRNQRKTVAQARESLHDEVMRSLGETLHRANSPEVLFSSRRGLKKIYRGEVNQLTTLGLFTRYGAHPWLGAWPTLTYHDAPKDGRAAISKNVDVILTESTPSMESPEMYALQVKTACLGLCGKDRGTHFDDPRTKYDQEVILVSAECDLHSTADGRHDYPVAGLLRKEYKEEITPAELAQLDQVGNELLLAITGANENRRGTLLPLEP